MTGWAFLFLLFSHPASSLDYQSLQDGLDYVAAQPNSPSLPKMHLLRVDLKKFQVRVLDAREMHSQTLSVKEMARKSNALAAINANFFDSDRKPLGLVVENGKIINLPKPVSWYAALLLKADKARILKVYDSAVAKEFDFAIQAGPRLVVSGKTPKLKSETSPKSAVGIDSKGRLVLIASEGGAEINELAQWLALPEKKGGAGLHQALNLDGGSSTQFFAKVGKLDLWIPGFSNVPIALGVFPRSAAESRAVDK